LALPSCSQSNAYEFRPYRAGRYGPSHERGNGARFQTEFAPNTGKTRRVLFLSRKSSGADATVILFPVSCWALGSLTAYTALARRLSLCEGAESIPLQRIPDGPRATTEAQKSRRRRRAATTIRHAPAAHAWGPTVSIRSPWPFRSREWSIARVAFITYRIGGNTLRNEDAPAVVAGKPRFGRVV